jgi:hypothetical protein
MKFTVVMTNGEFIMYVGSFRVADSGILIVEPVGGNSILLSPAAWVSLEVTDDPTLPEGVSPHYA